MSPWLTAAIAFSFSQLALSILLLLRSWRSWSTQEMLLCVFLFSTISYLAFPFVSGHWLERPIVLVQTLLPGLFWLFCARLFDDQFRLTSGPIILVLISSVIPFVGHFVSDLGLAAPKFVFDTVPQALEFLFLGLAILVTVRSWRTDLVEARRDLRLWFCAMIGFYMFTLILLREVIFPGAAWLAAGEYFSLGVICLVTNNLLLQYKPTLLHEASKTSQDQDSVAQTNAEIEISPELLSKINKLMQDEHVYREMGLTIGQLAQNLDLQEYKLRKVINAGLGHRNFNDFLNGYRIRDAGQRLVDPTQAEEAVLNIALDTGFRSLSSFNKAFKARYGKTPTEFRNAHYNAE